MYLSTVCVGRWQESCGAIWFPLELLPDANECDRPGVLKVPAGNTLGPSNPGQRGSGTRSVRADSPSGRPTGRDMPRAPRISESGFAGLVPPQRSAHLPLGSELVGDPAASQQLVDGQGRRRRSK